MVQAILITGWRNDTGAYLLDSFPAGVDIDGQDLMNLYNLHRFRDTKANFQVIITSAVRLCSFYSGGYNSPYVGKPNYGIALMLDVGENPDIYEKPLRKITNNLLLHLDDDDFSSYFENVYHIIKENRFDEIKIERRKVSGSIPHAIETTSTIGTKSKIDEDKDIFDDLIATVGDDFTNDDSGDDLFGGSSSSKPSADDPFGGGSSDPFAGSSDPFSSSSDDLFSPSSVSNPFDKMAASTPKSKKTKKVVATSKLMRDLQSIEDKIPKPPSDPSSEKLVKYLENKVVFLERKMGILSQIANTLQAKDKEIQEKDDLIAKLLLLLS